jgi:hypothetical protein
MILSNINSSVYICQENPKFGSVRLGNYQNILKRAKIIGNVLMCENKAH